MLMMLGLGAASGKKTGPANAHAAGRGCSVWQKKNAQLMLMMLCVGAVYGKKGAQLMLMMLGVGVASGKRKPS